MQSDISSKPYRILSLDGGGTWALIQAKALGEIYGHGTDGWTILDRFDFAAANSGGALVLALLLKGLSPNEILALFRGRRERELIFERSRMVDRALGGLFGFGPRYHTLNKLQGLLEIFERANGRWGPDFAGMTLDRIADLLHAHRRLDGRGPFHFLITAFDFDAERTVFFRSDRECASGAFRPAPCPTIAGALHATTNAPVRYFNRPAEVAFADGAAIQYWDGAVGGYNNPIMAAAMEALAADGTRRESIAVLSIGTGGQRLPVVAADWPGLGAHVVRRKRPRGPDGVRLLGDLRKITAAMMMDRPEAATYMAHIMLGNPPRDGAAAIPARIVRMNPIVQPRHAGVGDNGHPRWEPYEWFGERSAPRGRTLFERLAALDMDATSDADVQDIERLAELWIAGKAPNQPIHADERLVPIVGQGRFDQALAAWRALDSDPATARDRVTRRDRARERVADALRRFGDWLRSWRFKHGKAPAEAASVAAMGKVAAGNDGAMVHGVPPLE